MNEILMRHCKDFTGRGIRLFPVSRDKRPCITRWQEKATDDMTQIEKWADQFKDCNFAALAGQESGIVVLDVDVKNNQPGLLSLEELRWEFGVPATLGVKTPSGGYHYYFQYPEGNGQLHNKNEIPNYPGIEFKAYHAGCTIPGSCSGDGKQYTIEFDADIAKMPEGLLEIIKTRAKVKAVIEAARDAQILPGARNNTLYDRACSYLRDGYPEAEAGAMLKAYNQTWCTEPLDEDELRIILKSAVDQVKNNEVSIEHAFYTDSFNSERYLLEHGDSIRYDENQKIIYVYDGTAWRRNKRSMAMARAKDTVIKMYGVIPHIADDDRRKRFARHVADSENLASMNNMVNLAKNFAPIIIPEPDNYFNQNTHLLNCENVTFNLQTGESSRHSADDLLTQICPVEYDPKALCYNWHEFLATVFDGDQALIDYVQKICGYALHGSTGAKLWFIVYGTTDTGKSTFLNTLLKVFGSDYAMPTELDTLLTKDQYRIPAEFYRMKDKRLVIATETGITQKRRLDVPFIKMLTGGEKAVARPLYGQMEEFEPRLKLFLGTNHYPEAPLDDKGFWRRSRVIPFNHTIPEEDQVQDFINKVLRPEFPGILRWCIEGFRKWAEAKQLEMPPAVQSAVDAYREAMSPVALFIKNRCTVDKKPGAVIEVPVADLYVKFVAWCCESGQQDIGKQIFNKHVEEQGFTRKKSGVWKWKGIRLNSKIENEDADG